MYSKIQFKNTTLYKNTLYSILKIDKHIQKRTIDQLNSFFDESNTVNHFKYKRNELTNVIIPDNKYYYAKSLFSSCQKLNKITLSNNSKIISKWMFHDCINLKNIILPIGLTMIDECAFYGCKNLEYIDIPDTVCNINLYAFASCPNLKYIKFRGKKYTSPEKFNKALENYGMIKFADKLEYVWSK